MKTRSRRSRRQTILWKPEEYAIIQHLASRDCGGNVGKFIRLRVLPVTLFEKTKVSLEMKARKE